MRLEEANQCLLVVMGATPEGKKELVALSDGFRESEQASENDQIECANCTQNVAVRYLIGIFITYRIDH